MRLASKAIIVNKNQYLLQLRDKKKNIVAPNFWGFFGGKLKKNETPEQCIQRELYEELLINSQIVLKIYECVNFKKDTYIHFFLMRPKNKIKLENLKEGQSFGWFSKNKIKKIKTANDVKIFFDYLR